MYYRGIGIPYNAATRFIDENVEQGRGDKTAIYFEDRQVSYKELQEMTNKTGNGLKSLGVDLENRILLLCHDSPEFIASFFGAIKIGAVPVPVNTMLHPTDYEYFLNNSRSKVCIAHEDLWEKIKHLRKRFHYLQHVVVIGDTVDKREVIPYSRWMEEESGLLESAHTVKDDTAFWLFSSGSTGSPKGIIHLQHDMEYALDHYAKQVLNMSEEDITFSASKLFFAYGLGNGAYFPLGCGASTVLMRERPIPENVFHTIERYRPTIFFGVPTLYGAMINWAQQTRKQYDLSSIRICVSAGEPLPSVIYEKWKKMFGVDILDGIGSTEATHIFISNRIGDIKVGSSGKLVPGYEAKITDEQGQELPPNEVGDLLIKGDSIAHCYWNLHDENKRRFIGEWFHTGDKYYRDEEGYFWYCGRSDDMMKVGGIWVSPVEIEGVLLQHEAVIEAAVIGITDKENLVRTKAYVVLKEGFESSEAMKEELKEFVKQKLASYKCPKELEFIDELPKTANGKIQRFKLRSLADSVPFKA
ncbi:acetyl-CoA synthetase [Polycladomyces abyssicola]|uniref:Acetyl-CoA synthetase n=1 Tax=Polycladomyces abyssicola TaxID=1125966 RepID=A0A8D5UE36_9BACL|nr:benzoate-CoA ligase family protein [Polycladomyces abyssicola]BCU80588.1 acetyl-CoA synthetase [Polycladomyces abyssicola]